MKVAQWQRTPVPAQEIFQTQIGYGIRMSVDLWLRKTHRIPTGRLPGCHGFHRFTLLYLWCQSTEWSGFDEVVYRCVWKSDDQLGRYNCVMVAKRINELWLCKIHDWCWYLACFRFKIHYRFPGLIVGEHAVWMIVKARSFRRLENRME